MLTPKYGAVYDPHRSVVGVVALGRWRGGLREPGTALTPLAIAGRESISNYHPENVYEYREGNVYLISPVDEAAPLRADATAIARHGRVGR